MKRLICSLLTAVLLCALLPVSVLADVPAEYQRTGKRGYYYYGDQGYLVEYRYDVEIRDCDLNLLLFRISISIIIPVKIIG